MLYSLDYTIEKSDIQSDYNHVHHARTLCLLEFARLEFLRKIGYPNEQLMKEGIFLVLRHVDITYKRELFPGKVKITCENMQSKRMLMSVFQRILLHGVDDGQAAVHAQVTFVCMNGSTKRAQRPPEGFLKAFTGLP